MEDRIIALLNRKNKALSQEELFHLLELIRTEWEELIKTLNEMCANFTIYQTNKGRYMTFDRSPLKKGYLRINKKGFGFVDLEKEEDIYIDSNNLNGAIHNDLVVAEVIGRTERHRCEGRILKILERKLDSVVGEFYLENETGHIILDDSKLKLDVFNVSKLI